MVSKSLGFLQPSGLVKKQHPLAHHCSMVPGLPNPKNVPFETSRFESGADRRSDAWMAWSLVWTFPSPKLVLQHAILRRRWQNWIVLSLQLGSSNKALATIHLASAFFTFRLPAARVALLTHLDVGFWTVQTFVDRSVLHLCYLVLTSPLGQPSSCHTR